MCFATSKKGQNKLGEGTFLLMLVLFLIGVEGTNTSWAIKATTPARSGTRGTSTLAEDEGDQTPPQVNPNSTKVVEAIMITFLPNALWILIFLDWPFIYNITLQTTPYSYGLALGFKRENSFFVDLFVYAILIDWKMILCEINVGQMNTMCESVCNFGIVNSNLRHQEMKSIVGSPRFIVAQNASIPIKRTCRNTSNSPSHIIHRYSCSSYK